MVMFPRQRSVSDSIAPSNLLKEYLGPTHMSTCMPALNNRNKLFPLAGPCPALFLFKHILKPNLGTMGNEPICPRLVLVHAQ